MNTIEYKVSQLGETLPLAPEPKGNYSTVVREMNTLYLSGHIPIDSAGELITGKIIDEDNSIKKGIRAARICALSLISTISSQVNGDISKVSKICKLNGFVNCDGNFTKHPLIINGASDFFVAVFGEEIGKHARCAIGANSLPLDSSIEIDLIVNIC